MRKRRRRPFEEAQYYIACDRDQDGLEKRFVSDEIG